MTHANENLLEYTAIYRCSDDITNLKIRIRLNQVENSDQWEQKDFKWQQKIFSKSEREYYKDEKNCQTDLEKKYHLDVMKLDADAKFDLFSYVNDDDFVLREGINDYFRETNEECEEEEYGFKSSVMAAVRNPIGYNYEFDAMFIMADLGEYVDTTWIKYEKVLCAVKYDKKYKVMSIYPDFTNHAPYLIEVNGGTIRKFQYFVENVSEKMPEDDENKENELIGKVVCGSVSVALNTCAVKVTDLNDTNPHFEWKETTLNNHRLETLQQLDSTFVLPPKNKLQVTLFFEILWAKQFEYDTINVRYSVDLSSDWSCQDESQLQGITQTCHTKDYNIEELEKKGIPKCPYIYLEVISKDTWSRYRTEGLAYKNLPVAKPGNYRFELQCFRLISDSISGQLRRFFIGDCSSYNNVTWIGLPKDYEGPILNKYGTNTVGTGEIAIRMNVIHQSQAFLERHRENPEENSEIFEKLNSSSLVKSVEQVLQAFKRARKNMIVARKNL